VLSDRGGCLCFAGGGYMWLRASEIVGCGDWDCVRQGLCPGRVIGCWNMTRHHLSLVVLLFSENRV